MEILLAIVVASAVIFFGALISLGNERQHKALDELRKQTELWALQDLRIKRESLARNVRVEDPLHWLNKLVTKLKGINLNLQVIEFFDEPQTLTCVSGDGNTKLVFSPLSPEAIRSLKRSKPSRLAQLANSNPLLSLPRNCRVFEISVLNGGILFDLELPLVWKGLTGQTVEQMERIWVYDS